MDLPWRKRWRLTLLLLPPAILVLLVLLGAALTCRPSWYQPASIDYGRLQEDKRAQLRLENEISAALNSGRPVEFELDEAQVNRWITARHELWPTDTPSLEPFQRPQVTFLSGDRLRLGALMERSGVRVVLSATFSLDLRPDTLVVTWDSVHAGVLPAPRGLLEEAARRVAGEMGLGRRGVSERSLTISAEGTWPNGKRRVRITRLSIDDGVVRVRLEPL